MVPTAKRSLFANQFTWLFNRFIVITSAISNVLAFLIVALNDVKQLINIGTQVFHVMGELSKRLACLRIMRFL